MGKTENRKNTFWENYSFPILLLLGIAVGSVEKLHITPANTYECNHLLPLLEGIAKDTTVYADKGYDSKENRQHLKDH